MINFILGSFFGVFIGVAIMSILHINDCEPLDVEAGIRENDDPADNQISTNG
jgi:hypothetical protein